MDTFALRVRNLKNLINDRYEGNQAAMAADANLKAPQVNRWISATSKDPRRITEDSARNIELALKLPKGWLDKEHDTIPSYQAQEERSTPPQLALSNSEQLLIETYRSLNRTGKTTLLAYAKGLTDGQNGKNITLSLNAPKVIGGVPKLTTSRHSAPTKKRRAA